MPNHTLTIETSGAHRLTAVVVVENPTRLIDLVRPDLEPASPSLWLFWIRRVGFSSTDKTLLRHPI